jgi:hypothetical protein
MKQENMSDAPSAQECTFNLAYGEATQAMLTCLEGIRDTAPEMIADHMPPGWGMHRIRDAFKLHECERQAQAKSIVEGLAAAGALSTWVQSAAREWQYANLDVGGHTLRVGASTGGVVSFNGDPFVPSTREMCITKAEITQSLNERIDQLTVHTQRMEQRGAPVSATCTAYQVSDEDIENVMQSYSLRVTDTQGKSFETMAAELINTIDCTRVEKAALRAGNDLDDQTQAANEEIKKILVELGVLDF